MTEVQPRILAPDASIFDVLRLLNSPQGWFLDVIHNLKAASAIDADATVRIGVSGEGKAPFHLISYRNGANEQVLRSFFGAKEDTKTSIHPQSPDWSTKASSLDDVRKAFNMLPPEVFKKGR